MWTLKTIFRFPGAVLPPGIPLRPYFLIVTVQKQASGNLASRGIHSLGHPVPRNSPNRPPQTCVYAHPLQTTKCLTNVPAHSCGQLPVLSVSASGDLKTPVVTRKASQDFGLCKTGRHAILNQSEFGSTGQQSLDTDWINPAVWPTSQIAPRRTKTKATTET